MTKTLNDLNDEKIIRFHIQERASMIKQRYLHKLYFSFIDLNPKYIPINQPNYLISACNSWVGRTEEAAVVYDRNRDSNWPIHSPNTVTTFHKDNLATDIMGVFLLS